MNYIIATVIEQKKSNELKSAPERLFDWFKSRLHVVELRMLRNWREMRA